MQFQFIKRNHKLFLVCFFAFFLFTFFLHPAKKTLFYSLNKGQTKNVTRVLNEFPMELFVNEIPSISWQNLPIAKNESSENLRTKQISQTVKIFLNKSNYRQDDLIKIYILVENAVGYDAVPAVLDIHRDRKFIETAIASGPKVLQDNPRKLLFCGELKPDQNNKDFGVVKIGFTRTCFEKKFEDLTPEDQLIVHYYTSTNNINILKN